MANNQAETTFVIPLELMLRHRNWAVTNFGDKEEWGPVGPLRHLSKEALEAAEATDPAHRVTEFADCMFLFLDSMYRAGISNADLVEAMQAKMPILEARTYRKAGKDQPIEHDRSIED